MDTRRIGTLEVSVVGLGCNNFGRRLDADATARVVHAALDAGITFFDTADVYGPGTSEEYLGRALKGRRDEVVIATKFGMKVGEQQQGASPAYIRRACEASLRRLGVERIDLYQLHTPDSTTPIDYTLAALDELVRAGKVKEIGCSNFTVAELHAAALAAKPRCTRFASVQNEYSLLHREPEHQGVLEECARERVAFLPYFPLASGLLTGKYRRGRPLPEHTRLSEAGPKHRWLTEERLDVVESLAVFAEAHGHTLLELAFAWLLAGPVVASVIAGATKEEQVRANAAATTWRLSEAELAEVDRLAMATA
jgi:aryl-alcohol dehydrogenase-like predicted oxidoreductase